MAGIKETAKIQVESATLALQEAGFSFGDRFSAMPVWKKRLAIAMLIALIPGYVAVRFGTEYYLSLQYGRQALVAHEAFSGALNPEVGKVQIIRNPNGLYSAFVEVVNPNLDLSAPELSYSWSFTGKEGEVIYATSGSTYLLPNEKKYLVVPRIESAIPITAGKISVDQVAWQKRLAIPDIELKVSEPLLYDEANPLAFFAEGSVINNSPYTVQSVRLVFLLYDNNNKVIGISQRDENRIVAYGRRAYKQQWPGLYRNDVRRVQVIAYTNALDPANLLIEQRTEFDPNE